MESSLHSKLACGIPLDGRSGFASRLVSENLPDAEHVKTRVGRSAIQKLLNGGKLSAPSGKYGENHGDPVHFSTHQSSEMQIGDHALVPARASQLHSICVLNRPVKSRQMNPILRLTAEMIQNLSALSGVAYEKLGAISPSLVAPTPAPTPMTSE